MAAADGVKRMERVIDCIPSADTAVRMVDDVKKVSCVAALYEQRFSTKLTPVLKGDQSFKKTAFVERLASVVDGHSWRACGSTRPVRLCISHPSKLGV